MRISRLAAIATGSALAATLAACGYNPTLPASGPVAAYPSSHPAAAPAALEYGRVTNIQYYPGGTASAPAGGVNVSGAILGAVAGAVAGNLAGRAIGDGSTRDKATVLGGVAGAAIGSQAGQPGAATTAGTAVYRVTVQADQGAIRVYDVPATGDLRIGDRVRVHNGVIYRA